MLQTHATGKGKTVVLLGFTEPDFDHLTANQPIALDPKQLGLPDRPMLILYEHDPMAALYKPLPVTVILFRDSTLAALRASRLIELPLAGPGIQEGTVALLFYARDDEGLLAVCRKAKLLSPSTRVTSDQT